MKGNDKIRKNLYLIIFREKLLDIIMFGTFEGLKKTPNVVV